MALSLRELFYNIRFQMDDRGVVQGEQRVAQFRSATAGASRELRTFSAQALRSGNVVSRTIGYVGTYVGIRQGVRLVKDLTNEASDLAETMSFFNVVFPTMADSVESWSNKTADALSRGRIGFIESLTSTQDLFTGFGATEEAASNLSKQVLLLVTDLSSAKNINQDRAFDQFTSGLLGQHRAFKSLGIAVNEVTLKEKARELGISDNLDRLSELTKMQLRFAVSVDQSKNVIGDAERTSDSYANVVQGVTGQIRDLKAELGEQLQPAMLDLLLSIQDNIPEIKEMGEAFVVLVNDILPKLTQGFEWFIKNREQVGSSIKFIGTGFLIFKAASKIAIALGAVIEVVSTLGFAFSAVAGGAATVGEAILFVAGGPVSVVIAVIAAIIAAIVILIKNLDKFKQSAREIAESASRAFESLEIRVTKSIESISNIVKGFKKVFSGDFLGGFNQIDDATANVTSNVVVGVKENLEKRGTTDHSARYGGYRNVTNVPAYANGGTTPERGLFQVNERGGELQILDKGTTVVPHDLSKSYLQNNNNQSVKMPDISITIQESSNPNQTAQEVKTIVENALNTMWKSQAIKNFKGVPANGSA